MQRFLDLRSIDTTIQTIIGVRGVAFFVTADMAMVNLDFDRLRDQAGRTA
jgi:hypothetical protein